MSAIKGINVNGHQMVTGCTREELNTRVAQSATVIKSLSGCMNNAAWACALEAHDRLKTHPLYRHKVRQAFTQTLTLFNRYENNLVYGKYSLFDVSNLLPEERKRYGDITDREYYEYWCAVGSTAYYKKHDWVTMLQNKFKVSLEKHGVEYPEICAWGLTADACLQTAHAVYGSSIEVAHEAFNAPTALLHIIFGGLDLKAVAEQWSKAMGLLGVGMDYELDDFETGNIQLALDQMSHQLLSLATISDSMRQAIMDYDDLFRTPGEQKKALKEAISLKA